MLPLIRPVWVPLIAALFSVALPAQDYTIPRQLDGVPGNAAISMPVRWSKGVMQVIWDQSLIAELKGRTLRRIRLRRPSFIAEPDYPALQRRVVVRLGMTSKLAAEMTSDLADNRPPSLTVVAGPAVVSLPALPAHGPGDAVAGTLVDLTFDQPFTVADTGNLFLEWENLDSSLSISPDHWIDAVRVPATGGLALEVGNGGCSSDPVLMPMALTWVAGAPPASGVETNLHLRGGPPGAPALIVLGLDPQNRQPPWDFGFGSDLGAVLAPGCYQWTGLDLSFAQVLNPLGALSIELPFPSGVDLAGQRVGIQVLAADPQANPPGLALSNGILLIMDDVGFRLECATVLALDANSQSPFLPFKGLAPIVTFGF